MKFRKHSLLVDASRWFKEGDHQAVERLAVSGGGSPFLGAGFDYATFTPEGLEPVLPGDWIVTEENGVSFPVRPEVFHRFYVEA